MRTLLGAPSHTERVDHYPEWMPGEISSYEVGPGRTADVRYYRTRAATLAVYLEPAPASVQEALAAIGATRTTLRPTFQSPVVRRYSGSIGGIVVDEVTLSGGDRGWGMVVVKFAPG